MDTQETRINASDNERQNPGPEVVLDLAIRQADAERRRAADMALKATGRVWVDGKKASELPPLFGGRQADLMMLPVQQV